MKALFAGLALLTAAGPAVAQDTPPPPPGGGAMMRADTDGDGIITRAEMIAQATQRFDRMDRDHDGKLTSDELQQIGRRMGRMGAGDMPPPPLPAPPPAN